MMKREDRAKQFAPFNALTGLRLALEKKEREHERVEKLEVSDDRAEHLEKMLVKLERGDRVRVTYYNDGYYLDVTGIVSAVDRVYKFIKIGEGKVFFDDIFEIKYFE